MLDDTGPRRLAVGVVDRSIALKAGLVEELVLKADRAVLQRAQLIIKVSVNGAGVDHLVSQCIQCSLVFQIVSVQAHFNAVQQVGNHLGVAADGDALIQRVEIVVVKGQAHRQSLDDEGGQILAIAAPLLLGVALDELLIDVAAHKGDGLFFQVLRLAGDFFALLLNFGGSFLRRDHTPHLIKSIHIEGQRVELALVVGNRRVGKAVELRKLGDIIPDFFVVGMEDMCAVLVDVDTLDVLGVDIARNVGALINHQHALAVCLCLMRKDSAVQAGADYQIIIHIAVLLYFNLLCR